MGSKNSKKTYGTYHGEYKNGKMFGKGTFNFITGDKYEGDF